MAKKFPTSSGFLRWLVEQRSGAVAVEAALGILVMMAILLPLIDFGRYIGVRIELKQALRAGGQYALIDRDDTTSIAATIIGATGLTSAMTINIGAITCECFDGTTAVCPGESGYATCTGDIAPGGYLPISASVTFNPYFVNVAGFTTNMTVSEKLVLRVY